MEAIKRQELAIKFSKENMDRLFPESEKDSVKHALVVNGLAHGFSGGLRYAEDYPSTDPEAIDSCAMKYAFKYAMRTGAAFQDKEDTTQAFFEGFKAGLTYGLTTIH